METPTVLDPKPPPMSIFHRAVLLGLMAVCIVYILNPTAGCFELVPDNIPYFGNLDEAGATALLIWAGRQLFPRTRSSR